MARGYRCADSLQRCWCSDCWRSLKRCDCGNHQLPSPCVPGRDCQKGKAWFSGHHSATCYWFVTTSCPDLYCQAGLRIEWGILIMYFIGYGCSLIAGQASFRTAWGIQFVPCVFLMCGLPFLPRSPRWLAKVDRTEEAITTLAHIQAGGNVNDPLDIAEWEEISETLAAERLAPQGWRKFVYNGMWKTAEW